MCCFHALIRNNESHGGVFFFETKLGYMHTMIATCYKFVDDVECECGRQVPRYANVEYEQPFSVEIQNIEARYQSCQSYRRDNIERVL